MADPTISQNSNGFFQSIYDGIFKGDFSSNENRVKTATQIGVGLIPIAGQIADARDTLAAAKQVSDNKSGAWSNLALSLVGWIPLAGDFIKSTNKIGIKNTLGSIGEAFSSVKKTWKELSSYSEEKMGKVGSFFYHPATNMKSNDLSYGTLGATNRWGDIDIQNGLDAKTQITTLDHEKVHRFFSPQLNFGQELRANIRFLGYLESHLLRRTEEGLAEAWSKFKSEGFSGLKEGWRFPYDYDYGINPERVKIERNILIGAGSSALGAGSAIGESLAQENNK